ncbi:MAG: translocation/assembly module TamB domain-containing protein [Flavipsychrobacter sp.]|nr:translocation/assembly module TamB domain-containing protein [Flavipsychrobacter sp.]
MRNTILIIIGLVICTILSLNFTPVQNFVVTKATQILGNKLGTKVAIQHVRIDFLNHVLIQGLYIEDKSQDTLAYIGEARVRITDWFFLKKGTPVLKYAGLKNTYAHLYRTKTSEDWNYQFIIDAFDTGPSTKKKKKGGNDFEIDLKKVELENVRFHMDDAWVGSDMDFDVGDALIDAEEINFKEKLIDLNKISFGEVAIVMRDYDGGRPPRPKKPKIKTIDTTAFNKDNWKIVLNSLQLEDCYFGMEMSERAPSANEFDTDHMRISNINIDAEELSITGDTLKAKLNNLSAKERCGLIVKQFKGDVTVSPNASIVKKLLLETNHSKLQRYYAMHYTRFPDFEDYINKVRMVAKLDDSYLDVKDVAYFAPVLRQYPSVIQLSGKIDGTVADITGKNLYISDGISTVKGNLRMKGLPDIEKTFIDYQNGELYTNAKGIFRYAPDLKNNNDIAIDQLTNVSFKGNFTGYINNFACTGILATNLGTIQSDVKMKIPDGKNSNAIYSGTISADNFNIGALLKQSTLGTVTFNTKVDGNSFDPAIALINVDASVKHIDFNGYRYQNITLDGAVEKNKFGGNLLIDDPNLALAFYGNIDLSQKLVRINAKANLLKSNFAALNLLKDSITATADFDLDCVGSSIDNFSGYAKLYNINMVRSGHRLDIDSVYVNASEDDGQKLIVIESNALTARIKGQYELSKLPYSFQYYLSGYLPNYINKPTQEAPPQDISFNIVTKEIDSLLGIVIPKIKGFSGATIDGKLNTSSQQLQLNALVPYGEVNGIILRDVSINGTGDFNKLAVDAKTQRIVIGDSILSGALEVNTTLANNDLNFRIATTSADKYGTATLKGTAHTSSDSVWLNLQPSELYLNDTKWDIPTASLLYSSNYLFINKFELSSGIQSINVYSKNSFSNGSTPPVFADIKNIDVSQIGNLIGFSDYQLDGRINGELKVEDLFGNMLITSNIRATDVKIGTDTLGNIIVAGGYDAAKQKIHLDNTSGVYRGNASITASGDMSFDSTSKEPLNGKIQFNSTPMSWLNPVLAGFVSKISGTINGEITIGGSAVKPDVDGSLKLMDAAMRIDFLGTYYNIPAATIAINNTKIDLGKITLYDVYKNTATLSGQIKHDRFQKMNLGINMTSKKFEVINLEESESELFYGNLIASIKSLSVSGDLDKIISINILGATPVEKSHLYLPLSSSSGLGTYNYVTFKSYGTEQQIKKKSSSKLSISIEALVKDLCEVSLVMDPATGDAINASGNGTLRIEMPAGNDMRMSGVYTIKEGDYTFTLKQLAFKRNFKLNSGSKIYFNGPIDNTQLEVTGKYTTKARLFDLLNNNEKKLIENNDRELEEARVTQDVNILLFMKGSMGTPRLTFQLELPNSGSVGTVGYNKLMYLNQNDRELNNQVASLLLINTFIPDDGGLGNISGGAVSGGISNISQMLSGQVSSQLTNVLNKLTGDESLSIDFKYKSYSLNEKGTDASSRNEVSLGVKKNLFRNLVNDRLTLEVGSSYDWGKPTSNRSASNFNPVGDFRLQYQFREGGNLRGYIFRTNNYDVVDNRNIARGGVGINWHKSFNALGEFFRGRNYFIKKQQEEAELQRQEDSTRESLQNQTRGTQP